MSPSLSTSAVARAEWLQVRANHSRARADVQPARAEIPEHANAAGRGRQQIEQAIVVVVHELRGGRTRGVSIGGADDIAAASVAHRELTGVAAGMKEVDVPVLVDVTRRRHAGGTFEGQADVAGHVLEGAVAHVAVERGRRRRPHQQEIDVAPVVVVGRDYGADGLRVAEGRGSRDILEGPLAAVAKQTRRGRGATDQQIEVAVVIGVEPCGAAIGSRITPASPAPGVASTNELSSPPGAAA